MASYVITRSGSKTTKTYFSGGKPSSSITVNNRTGKVITSSKNYRSDRIAELEKKGVDRAIASQISLVESKGQKFAQITPEIARQVKEAKVKSPSFKQADVVRLAQEKFQIKRKNTFEGTIKGNYYTNLSKEELEKNKLARNSKAIFQPSRTNLIQGRGTSRDLFNVLSKGKKELDILKTRNSALRLINIQNKIRGQKVGTVQGKVYAQLSKEEILNNKLNPNSKAILLSSKSAIRQNYKNVANSLRNVYQGNATSNDILTILSKGTNIVNLLENEKLARKTVAFAKERTEKKINLQKAIKESPKKQKSAVKQIFQGFSKSFLDYVSSLGKGALKLVVNNKKKDTQSFLDAPIFKSYWKTKIGNEHLRFIGKIRETGRVSSTKLSDPDVRNFLILTGFLLLPQSKLLNLGFKGFAGLGLGYSGAKAVDTLVNKNYSTSGQALFEASLYSLIFLNSRARFKKVKNLKTSKAKVGEILIDPKGNYAVVTKGGRRVKLTKSQAKTLIKAQKKGEPFRKARTESARQQKAIKTKIAKGKKLTKEEINLLALSRTKKTVKKYISDANKISKKLGYKGKTKNKFTELYIKYQNNPTNKNINNLKKFGENTKVDQIVASLNKKIIKQNLKARKNIKITKTKDAKQFLKEQSVPIKKISKEEMMKLILNNKELKEVWFKKNAKFQQKKGNAKKIIIPEGITDGKTVKILKGLTKAEQNRIIKHEAIHVLKGHSKITSLNSKFPKATRLLQEAQTSILTASTRTKFPVLKNVLKQKELRLSKKADIIFDALNKKISNQLFKEKYGISKTKFNKILSKTRKEIRSIGGSSKDIKVGEKLAFDVAKNKKGAVKKLSKLISNLRKKQIKKDVKTSISKLDKKAKQKGFKDLKEQKKYELAFEKYKLGDIKAEKVLLSIEKKMFNRKTKLSIKKSKEYTLLRKRLVKEAKELLSKGRLKIKDKGFKVIPKKRNQLSKKEAEALALAVQFRLDKLEKKKLNKEKAIARFKAKKVLNEIINKGKSVEITNPLVERELKILLSKDKIADLRNAKALKISKGLIKGKQPRTRLTKAEKQKLKLKAKELTKKERIARKRDKFKLAGEKKERKIRRKQYLEQIRKEENIIKKILSGEDVDGFKVELSDKGAILLKVKSKTKKIKFAKDILKKKNIPKDAVKVSNKDGTIQLLKTDKITKKVENKVKSLTKRQKARLNLKVKKEIQSLKQELIQVKQLKQKLIKKTVSKLKQAQKNKVKLAQKQILGLKQKLSLGLSFVKKLAQKQNLSLKQAQSLKQRLDLLKIQDQALDKALDQAQKIDSSLDKLRKSKSIQNLRQNVKKAVKTDVKEILKQITKPKKKVSKEKPIKEKKKININLKIPFNKPLPRGYRRKVNGYIKIGKRKVLVVKGLPENKAWNKLFGLGTRSYRSVDNSLARSFEFKVVGLTKAKDDVSKIGKFKVRLRKGKDPRVLLAVEKSKYALDSKGEKNKLSIYRRLKKNAKKTKNTKVGKRIRKKRTKRKRKK